MAIFRELVFFSPSLSLRGQVLIMICGFSVAKALISCILVFNTVIEILFLAFHFANAIADISSDSQNL